MTHNDCPATDALGAQTMLVQGALLLDVREPEEWVAGHAPQAKHMPLDVLHPERLPTDRVVVAVCRSGRRSERATRLLRDQGIDAINLDGGMQAWSEAGLLVITDKDLPGEVV